MYPADSYWDLIESIYFLASVLASALSSSDNSLSLIYSSINVTKASLPYLSFKVSNNCSAVYSLSLILAITSLPFDNLTLCPKTIRTMLITSKMQIKPNNKFLELSLTKLEDLTSFFTSIFFSTGLTSFSTGLVISSFTVFTSFTGAFLVAL